MNQVRKKTLQGPSSSSKTRSCKLIYYFGKCTLFVYNYIASCGGFRTCTAEYAVQQLSHSNYLKQSGSFIGVFIESN